MRNYVLLGEGFIHRGDEEGGDGGLNGLMTLISERIHKRK